MKKILIFFVFSILTNFAFAQNTILWSIKKPNSEKTSYLLGTFHQIGNSFVDDKPLIKELLSKSDLVIFEAIEDKDEKIINVMLSRTEDFSYREQLMKEDVDFLENYTKNFKVPLSKVKPGELITKFQQEIIKEKCETIKPSDTSDHMDDYLQELAEKQNIKISGLESYSDQMNVINKSNKEEFTWNEAKDIVHLYIIDYKTKDEKRKKDICALSTNYMKMKLDYQLNIKCAENDEIFSKRNEIWMTQIKKSVEENNSVFIIVGLFHLYGECGIISKLKQDGYEVNPIKLK